jgi:hypothetical protein
VTGNCACTTKVELVVKLAPATARGSAAHNTLLACVAELGIALESLDPSASEGELAGYHVAIVPSDTAARAIERLRQCEGVEAAFAKPRGETPTGGTQHGK